MKISEFIAGDKFLNLKTNKEFVIDKVNIDDHEWYIIETKDIIFRDKHYDIFKNTISKQNILKLIDNGKIKKL